MSSSDRDAAVDRLLAEQEIRNLIARLAHLADDGDIEEYLDLWTEDATWTAEGVPHTGRDARRARIHAHRADGTQGPGTSSRHLNTTLWVAVDSDEATAQSYYVYMRDATTAPHVARTGRYYDTFRRTPDGWKYAERRIVSDIN